MRYSLTYACFHGLPGMYVLLSNITQLFGHPLLAANRIQNSSHRLRQHLSLPAVFITVIRCLIQWVSPKIAIFTTFLFSGDAPGAITLNVVWIEENSMLTNCLAACAHLTITVSEIERDICEKNRHFVIPLAFDAPVRGFPSEYRHSLWDGKTRMVSLPNGKKKFEDMFIRFDVIHERDGRIDGQTDTA